MFVELLRLINNQRAVGHWPVIFKIKFLSIQGVEPDWRQSGLDPGTQSVARNMAASDWSNLMKLKPSNVQLGRLSKFLEDFVQHQNW